MRMFRNKDVDSTPPSLRNARPEQERIARELDKEGISEDIYKGAKIVINDPEDPYHGEEEFEVRYDLRKLFYFVPAGAGVFHMWAAPNGSQLWVNNDIDNTTTVINPISMKVKGTAETPADLVAAGGKPHDVFFDPQKKFVYVTVLGVNGPNDYVVKYKAGTFAEVDRVAVGKDPHLFADDVNGLLYVPCQGSDGIYVVDRASMEVQIVIPLAGAHGIFMPASGSYVYAANIAGSQLAVFETGITVGTNPFGLVYYRY